MSNDRERVTFATTPEVKALLLALCETGLYGRTYHETAERLLSQVLQEKFAQRVKAPIEPREQP